MDYTAAARHGWAAVADELEGARWTGDQLHATCWHPDHPDHTPSTIYYSDGGAYCFGCGRKSDIYDYLAHTRGWAHSQAAQWLTGTDTTARRAPDMAAHHHYPNPDPTPSNPAIRTIMAHTRPADGTPIHTHLTTRKIWDTDTPLPATLRWLPNTAPIEYVTKMGQTRAYHHTGAAGAAIWALQTAPTITPHPDHLVACQIQSVTATGQAAGRWSPHPIGPVAHYTAHIDPDGEEIWLVESPTDAIALTHATLTADAILGAPYPIAIVASMSAHRLPKIAAHLTTNRRPYRLFPHNDPAGWAAHQKTLAICAQNGITTHTYTDHHTGGHNDIASHLAAVR